MITANHTMAYKEIECVQAEMGRVTLHEVELPAGRHYELRVNGIYVMATYCQESESALAWKALDALGDRTGLQVLIGGLGMGVTLREALNCARVSRAVVVEIVPEVEQWCRAYFGPFNDDALEDERTEIVVQDMNRFLADTGDRFDAILLDMDNGPNSPILDRNAGMYSTGSLTRWRDVLTEGGAFAVWAARPDEAFEAELRELFSRVEVHEINTSVSLQTEWPDMVYLAVK